ncbi:MAG TPA: hypothetical protein VFG99_10785 [Chloroflexia bacterium]|nr:hypothetical protein [Chloroflexia bacterium]
MAVTPKDSTSQPEGTPDSSPTGLDLLVGTWRTDIFMPIEPPIAVQGRTTCEWLEEGPFLVVRGSVEHPEFPSLLAIIGGDETTGAYAMLYFDSRGVSRIYAMSLSTEAWKLWREAPGFFQRFVGTFSDDRNTVTGYWEKSSDGSDWELDFNLTYTRI